MENENKKLLWIIIIVNVLTLILLIGLIVASWDVIVTKRMSQQETKQQAPTSIQQQIPQNQQQPSTGGQMQPPTNGTMQGKCGDNVCDDFEKSNKNLCPQDCK